ncbi:MAG: hypothetical protein KC917_11460 [Candidatus Omnitrophica bacterium]|nr:hypothetical protein [Candidatus Omnitrophota bacterium]MCA9431593.1 hypothetical protein [Candidatus Omnitrophota bacterium]
MNKIPQSDSIEELARFWDTHDLTEFEDELQEVSERVFQSKTEPVIRLQLSPDQASILHRLAESRGVDDGTLVREWVEEKLRAS